MLAGLLLTVFDVLLLVGTGWSAGWWIPSTLCLGTGVLGLLIMLHALLWYGDDFQEMHDEAAYVQKLLVLLAGFMLLLPGPSTDVIGLVLLVPAVRRRAAAAILRHLA